MSPAIKSQRSLSPTTLVDELMSTLHRGDDALFAELARYTWDPQATLADLAGTLGSEAQTSPMREAA